MSGRRVRFEQEAVEDLEKAVKYYCDEAGDEAVALRFVDAVEAARDLLASQSEAGRRYEVALHPRLRDTRVWPLAGFPYLLFYQVTDDTVLILAVVEGHQDLPEFFRRRYGVT